MSCNAELQQGPLPAEEVANCITHGIGLVISLIGAFFLTSIALAQGDVWRIAGCSIYTSSLVAVYATSTLSHSFSAPQWRRLFRILDQGFIYLLIVGTYTPFVLAFLRTGPWLLYLGLLWAVAISGFFSKILFAHRIDGVSIWIYVGLGWAPIVSAPTLVSHVAGVALWWMLIGGVCYTVGTLFLIFDQKFPHFHAVWHLFVIAGSTCHFFSILMSIAHVH